MIEDDVRTRLQQAALDLFEADGFDGTTAAAIAAQAGVTERTFFRHFADKREVLFDGEAVLRAALAAAIAAVPADVGPLDVLFRAVRSVVPAIEANRQFAKPRYAVIAATPALHERELAKIAALTATLAAILRARGVAALRAELAAQAGMAAFSQATMAWLDDPTGGLGQRLDQAFAALKELLTTG